jgi:hypothetical protein
LDVADVDPAAFTAVTATRSVEPTSAVVARYVEATAPETFAHALPAVSQRRHWYEYVMGSRPVHDPAVAVSVCPS